jgi:hypothetical protein
MKFFQDEPQPATPMALEEYASFIDNNLDPEDDESLLSSRSIEQFRRLLRDKEMVVKALNRELARLPRTLNVGSDFVSSALILHNSPKFIVRALFWTPREMDDVAFALEKRFQWYDQAHNHRASFLTGGYRGRSYETVIYRFDGDEIKSVPGDRAGLTHVATLKMADGRITYYEAIRDVHVQHPAEQPSITINVIPKCRAAYHRGTMLFDIQQDVVASNDVPRAMCRDVLFRAAEMTANDATISVCETIAREHPLPLMRAHAYRALARIKPQEIGYLVSAAAKDSHPYIKNMADQCFTQVVANSRLTY